MALIKCPDCKKEISDKSHECIHCGFPIEKELFCNECGKKISKEDTICKNCGCPIEKEKEKRNVHKILANIWLVMCIMICLLISGINFFNILDLEITNIIVGSININVMGILSLLLCISYVFLLRTYSKKVFIYY